MPSRADWLRWLSQLTRDAAFAYSCYALIPPHIPAGVWWPEPPTELETSPAPRLRQQPAIAVNRSTTPIQRERVARQAP